VTASCGSGDKMTITTSSSEFSQTFTTSASIGELVDFTFDSTNKTYSYRITQSSYGISDSTGSGTLISNADGSFSPSTQRYSKIYAVKDGLLVGSINVNIGGSQVNVPIYGTSSPIKSLAALAGTYNFVSSTCVNTTSGRGCGTTSYGTVKVSPNGNFVQCDRTNITTNTGCSDVTGTISYIANGVWKYQRNGSTNSNYLIGFTSPNGQNVFITDFNDPGGLGYGQAIGSTQSPLYSSNANDGTYFSQTNASMSSVTTVTGTNFETLNLYEDGRSNDTNSGTLNINQPWTGLYTATGNNGNSMGILAGTGTFVGRSTDAGYSGYYMVGLKK